RGGEAVWRSGGHGGIGSTGQPSVAQRRSLEIRQPISHLADWRTAVPVIERPCVASSRYASPIRTKSEKGATTYFAPTGTCGPSSKPTTSSGDAKAVSIARRQGRPCGAAGTV